MIHARDAAQNSISKVHLRDGSNTLVDLSAFSVRDSSGLHDLLNTFKASGPSEVDGYGYSLKSIQVTTEVATITVSGGTPPYVHSWSLEDSSWSATAPSSASTQFRSPILSNGTDSSATATDTITDSDGNVTAVSLSVYCSNLA